MRETHASSIMHLQDDDDDVGELDDEFDDDELDDEDEDGEDDEEEGWQVAR
jgi:hypothetical protein